MRLVLLILFLGLLWISGWIYGSLKPAPDALVTPVESWLSDDAPSTDDLAEDTAKSTGMAAADTLDPEVDRTPEPDPAPALDALQGEALFDQYRTWISEARATHPYAESEQRMFDVMICESGGRASAVNPAGPYTGLFQYFGTTWNGEWNPYRDNDVFDARSQIFATALAWNLDMQSHWGCYDRTQ